MTTFLIRSFSFLHVRYSALIFNWIFFILAGNKDTHKILDGFEISPRSDTVELVVIERLKNLHRLIMGEML